MENTAVSFPEAPVPEIYIAGMDDVSRKEAFKIVSELRKNGLCAECDHMNRSVKAQLKYADKCGAKFVAVIGESEISSGECNVKKMSDGTTAPVKLKNILSYLKDNK